MEVINPGIRAEELQGKYIVLDVRARDVDGRVYNVEIQVRRYHAWPQRAMYYLARLLSQQLASGQDYAHLHAVVGIHLLDFDLFTATETQCQQGYWRFEMRDAHQPAVTLGSVLQLTLIELKKIQRLGLDTQKLSAWVRFFEQWREDGAMEQITHAPVQDALDRLRSLSADEEAQRLAWVRERAQHDEATLLKEAREEGREEGLQQGLQQGEQQGLLKGEMLVLQRQLSRRFGPLPEWVMQRLDHADEMKLERWTDAVLDAPTLEAIFGPEPH